MSTTSNVVTIMDRQPPIIQKFRNAFRDHDYADAYARDFLNSTIATQIKVLREQREWTQEELAAKAGMKQPRIAVLEDVNYSSWSISTLWRLAKAFHVRLRVTFEEYGTLPAELESLNRSSLERRPLEEDPVITGERSAGPLVVQDIVPVSGVVVRTAGTGANYYLDEKLVGQLMSQYRGTCQYHTFLWQNPISAVGVESTEYASGIVGSSYVVPPHRISAELLPAESQEPTQQMLIV